MTKPSVYAILRRVRDSQLALKQASEEVNLPAHLAGGAGLGAAAGLGSAVIASLPAVRELVQIQGQLPHLQARRAELLEHLNQLRQQSPVPLTNISDRRLTKMLLTGNPTPQQYHFLRRGYEEGLSETSRATKTLKLLSKRIKANVMKRSLLGAGLGVGAGLLAATARGRFDQE